MGKYKNWIYVKKNWESWGPDIKIALIEMAKSHWPEVQNLLYFSVRNREIHLKVLQIQTRTYRQL